VCTELGRKKLDLCVKFDAYSFVEMISPRQLLKVVGERADTKYFNKEGIGFAERPEKLFIIKEQSHVYLYDDLSVRTPKLIDCFTRVLATSYEWRVGFGPDIFFHSLHCTDSRSTVEI
jgi:hypothetical protein